MVHLWISFSVSWPGPNARYSRMDSMAVNVLHQKNSLIYSFIHSVTQPIAMECLVYARWWWWIKVTWFLPLLNWDLIPETHSKQVNQEYELWQVLCRNGRSALVEKNRATYFNWNSRLRRWVKMRLELQAEECRGEVSRSRESDVPWSWKQLILFNIEKVGQGDWGRSQIV